MELIAGIAVIMVAVGLGWMMLAHYKIVSPFRWHGNAAWQALTQGRRGLATTTTVTTQTGTTAARAGNAANNAVAPTMAGTATGNVSGIHWIPWLGLTSAILVLAWMVWGTAVWLYNVPPSARRWAVWGDWIVWRWPVISFARLSHHPDAQADAWTRHKRTWVAVSATATSSVDLAEAARVLDAGFATSKPDAVWTTTEDGMTTRRLTVVATGDIIHPHWETGFHAGTMQEWVQWATQWAETALHHAGIIGTWFVSAEGIVRRSATRSAAPEAAEAETPVTPPKPLVGGLSDTTRWGRQGLTWGQLRSVALEPLPILSAPIPPERVQEVVQVLGHLGFPDTVAVGGQRGLTVDVAKIRPPAALAKRILAESATLAGQLGHGELPLRMAYVEGEAGVIAVERPRPDRQFVDLVTALARTNKETRQSLKKMALPVCCLVKADGSVLWSDASTWPHLLAGGTTGGGKTVTIGGWLTSLMITVPPSQLRMTLVDLKAGSSFPWAKDAPHVESLLTTPAEVQQLVAQWAEEMDARYEAFAAGGVADLKAAIAAGWTQYPYKLLVIDEFKDLKDQMEKDDLKEMERGLGRLVQKARGAGFFVWIATQHALAETINSTVKTNLDARLALKASSGSASHVILDDTGAETLLGNGDALFRSAPGKPPVRGQTPLATEGVWQAIREGWAEEK